MEMCRWFFKVLLKFQMAVMDELHNFLWAQKLKNLEKITILHSHHPSGNGQVILLKFEMATTSRFLDICDRKNNLWRGMM